VLFVPRGLVSLPSLVVDAYGDSWNDDSIATTGDTEESR